MTSGTLAGVKDHHYYYDPTENRLTNVNTSTGAGVVGLGYDLQGNLQQRNGQGYPFDYGNRLREVTGKEHYRYDGHGRRVLAWCPTQGSILSQYNQNGQLVFQQDQRQGKNIDHVYLAGSLVATREHNYGTGVTAVRYQHTDALGSPVAVTNEGGQVLERTQFEPYGAAIGKAIQGVGYTGHVMDAATGLTYMQQRYYSAGEGRFLSVDPVTADGNTGGNFNRYWYANGNPYKFTDPDGRYVCAAGKTNCAQIRRALSEVRKAMNALPKGSKAQVQLGRVLGFYGTEGVDNGVSVRSGAANGGAGTAETKGNRTTITINFKGIERVSGGANSTYRAYVRDTVAHEGSHGVDQRKEGMPTNRAMLERTERPAYRTEAHLSRGLGQDHMHGLWTRAGGYDEAKIEASAQGSVGSACRPGGC